MISKMTFQKVTTPIRMLMTVIVLAHFRYKIPIPAVMSKLISLRKMKLTLIAHISKVQFLRSSTVP